MFVWTGGVLRVCEWSRLLIGHGSAQLWLFHFRWTGEGLQTASEDTCGGLCPSSKVTAATGVLWAIATISHSLDKAGEWAPNSPSSHTFCSEWKYLLCRSEAGYGGNHMLRALVKTHFIVKHNSMLRAVGGGVGSTDNNEGLCHPSSRRRPHQFWHLSRGLGQDPVSGLAGEGRTEYNLLLRQWDLRRKWNRWFQISSSHTDVIRQTCVSGAFYRDVLQFSWLFEKLTGSKEFWDWGKFLHKFTVNVKRVVKNSG